MFDVIGMCALQPEADWGTRGSLATLPSETLTTAVAERIEQPKFSAKYVAHAFSPRSHAVIDGTHLCLVGEAYPRGRHRTGPLSAPEVLPYLLRDRAGLLATTKGNFTLVVFDSTRSSCELIGSRLAISPFYYAIDGAFLVFSSALSALIATLRAPRAIDLAAVAELALFNYPLGNRTYVRGVNMLRPAETARIDQHGVRSERWWEVRSLYAAPRLSNAAALEQGGELLHHAVNDLACDVPRLRVSFTSGFDSRAILALLDKPSSDVLTYAFGIPSSENVTIPLAMSKQLGFNFEPIYLEREYEEHFDENALRAVELSDCLSTLERANYPYAFERTAEFSPVVLTGLFGSELLRTFQNIGHIVSADLVRVHLSTDPAATVQQLMRQSPAWRYFNAGLFSACVEEVQQDVGQALTERFGDLPADQRFYMFLLSEGLRKYFGAETHMERPWGRNRFPFLDEEFVEFAFSAPFAGVHSRTLTPTVGNRFRSQAFYAEVIRRYRPDLLHASTDHGYPPGDLLSAVPLLKIGASVLLHRLRQRRSGYREFKTEEWTASFYRRHGLDSSFADHLVTPEFAEDFSNGQWLDHRLEFARAASFGLWLEQRTDRLCWP